MCEHPSDDGPVYSRLRSLAWFVFMRGRRAREARVMHKYGADYPLTSRVWAWLHGTWVCGVANARLVPRRWFVGHNFYHP